MSGGVSAGSMLMMGAAAMGGMMLAQSMAPSMPTMPTQQAPTLPQLDKAPEPKAMRSGNASNTSGPSAQAIGTMLTNGGQAGIAPGMLNLGANTLLGQ